VKFTRFRFRALETPVIDLSSNTAYNVIYYTEISCLFHIDKHLIIIPKIDCIRLRFAIAGALKLQSEGVTDSCDRQYDGKFRMTDD